MRFGMSGCFLPADMNDLTPELCRRIRELGYSGIGTRFHKNDPRDMPRSSAMRVRDVLVDNHVKLYQALGFWQNFITPDENARKEAVRTQQAAIRLAGWMGAYSSHTGPGSMSERGPWLPHPDNWSATCRRQLVKSLKECAPAAEDAGVYLTMEGHQLVTLESADVMAEVLDTVNSPWVKADYDSANWITLKRVYDTEGAINYDFDVLGRHIVGCHAKDIWIEDRLTLHLQEGCPGKGLVDFRTLFRRMEALSPDFPVIAEGNTTEELPQVSALFDSIAKELKIEVRK